MTETLQNRAEATPIPKEVILLLQLSWLEKELDYAETKMQDEIDRQKIDQTTSQTRRERFTAGEHTTTVNVVVEHISRYSIAINNIEKSESEDDKNLHKLRALQQLGKLTNVFADSAIWLKKQTAEDVKTAQPNDATTKDDQPKYTTLEDLFQKYIEDDTTDESLDIELNIQEKCSQMITMCQSGDILGAYDRAAQCFSLALKIWTRYIINNGIVSLPQPGLPSGTIKTWGIDL